MLQISRDPSEYNENTGTDERVFELYSNQTDLHLPLPRARHSMQIMGNPPAYLLLFGGYTVQVREYDNLALHLPLDDFWSFSLYSHKWVQIFP